MLLVNGCSFTYGEELPGWTTGDHFPQTWGGQLGKRLNTEVVNLSMGGASNDRIFRTTMEYLHNPVKGLPTHMVIMWSDMFRREVAVENISHEDRHIMHDTGYVSPNQEIFVNPHGTQDVQQRIQWEWEHRPKFRRNLDLLFPPQHVLMQQLVFMQTIEMLCEAKGIRLIQDIFHDVARRVILRTFEVSEESGGYKKWLPYTKGILNRLKYPSRWWIDEENWQYNLRQLALAGSGVYQGRHPKADTYEKYAEILFSKFKEFYDDTKQATP